MQEKINTSMRIRPYVLRELKIIAATEGKTIGDVAEALVKFHRQWQAAIDDEDMRASLMGLWETALVNSGGKDAA